MLQSASCAMGIIGIVGSFKLLMTLNKDIVYGKIIVKKA